MKKVINADGSVQISETGERDGQWNFRDADQAGKFLRGQETKDHPANELKKGDVSEIRDAANDFAKQRNS